MIVNVVNRLSVWSWRGRERSAAGCVGSCVDGWRNSPIKGESRQGPEDRRAEVALRPIKTKNPYEDGVRERAMKEEQNEG